MKVRNNLTDLLMFGKHTRMRNSYFKSSSEQKPDDGSVNRLSARLHPVQQKLKIISVTNETDDIRTYRLSEADGGLIAPFRAGQYLTLTYLHEGLSVSRPYSISSIPARAFKENFYEITIRKTAENAFFSEAAFTQWRPGTTILSSGPCGTFYYEPFRDSKRLICIAGGSGVTPFRSIIADELGRNDELSIFLFYGINTPSDEAFKNDFAELSSRYNERFVYIPVVKIPDRDWSGKNGFISLDLIKTIAGADTAARASFFICGPPGLHSHMDKELSGLNLKPKFIRRENFGAAGRYDPGRIYKLTVIIRGESLTIDASAGESLVTAIERAGLAPPAWCRSGDCGWCRSRLIAGEIETDDRLTGLRAADRRFGWIHPCMSFPAGDIILEVPANPAVPFR